MSVLMVAEKPILAESIARILSDGRHRTRKGANGACSVSEYLGTFRGQSARFKVTSTCGHVMGVDFPGRYNNWNAVEPLELFGCPIEKKEANPKLKMPWYLASEAKGCDFLVLWLDCDKEGENICFEVIDAVHSAMRFPNNADRMMDFIFRARFSAITEKEIKQAMRKLEKPNLNESLSVDARQELDLRIGCAFTRFQTRYFQDKYGDLDSTCISFGPCQTPTLAFCVQRHDQIEQFVSQPYWVLHVDVALPGGRALHLEWEGERQFDKSKAQSHLNKVKKADFATIVDIASKENKKEKPVALNTVEMLRVASNSLGLSPSQTMSVAENLYTRGYISYPRTETTSYPDSFEFEPILHELRGTQMFAQIASQILSNGIAKPKSGVNKGDHPPITPMKAMDGWLSGDNARLYEYVAQHFLATLMGPCRYHTKTVRFDVGDEAFTAQARAIIDPGFTSVMTWQAVSEEERLDELRVGQRLEVKEAKLVDRMTTAPDYLTEAELITLMEKYGIGTDASIPVHINNICNRNYVKVESGRRLVPTKLGISLIHGYQHVDPDLIQPTMRADVENQLELIAKGKADYKTIKDNTLAMFRTKFVNFVAKVGLVDALFSVSFTSLQDSGKPFSKCGKCRRFTKLISTRPQRLHCPSCQVDYNLPSAPGSNIHLHFEKTCPLDGFELLYFAAIGGKLSKSFAFCPNCYNNPPFEELRHRKMGCHECPQVDCPNSFLTQGVLPCLTKCFGGRGILVLDPQSGPKWRLSCNRCPAVVGIFEGASKLQIRDACAQCGAKSLHVEYKNEKTSKLPGNALTFTGCAFCEQHNLGECVNLNHAFLDKNPALGGGGRRGGRGGGRRGAGGGRGRGARRNESSERPSERGSGESRGGPRRGGRGGAGRGGGRGRSRPPR